MGRPPFDPNASDSSDPHDDDTTSVGNLYLGAEPSSTTNIGSLSHGGDAADHSTKAGTEDSDGAA